MCYDISRKKTVIKYGKEMEAIVRDIRRWITEKEHPPDAPEIFDKAEDAFFESSLSEKADIGEIGWIIKGIYERSAFKYGILEKYLNSSSINEIMVNGPYEIFVECNFPSTVTF